MASEAEKGQGNGAPTKSREVRLGLVMYGGVSLAIYINGVASELFRAVRGRGTYRLLKALTDSDIVVDVLSGSSAGGINGILLSYALCNECEFRAAGELWRQRGDVGGLMRGLDEPLVSYQSLFDSEHKYEPWLHDAFDAMGADQNKHDQPEDPSAFSELDLFVTGTDFYGRKWVTVDARGAEIQVKDHRTVFWLKHRAGRKEPFSARSGPRDEPDYRGSATTHAALARLARITSCFPAAFAPVTVGTTDSVDRRVRRWGGVPDGAPRVFIDGGVLDNKPFTTTIDAIYNRHGVRPVSRWLLYVEPDPERFEADPANPESPSLIKTALASLTALPAYESIAEDLARLDRHNDQVQRVDALRDAIIDQATATPSRADTAEYRRLRLTGLGERLFSWLFTREAQSRSPLEAAPDRDPVLVRARALEGQRALRVWFREKVVKGAEFASFHDIDVLFRLRRLFHISYACEGLLLNDQAIHRNEMRRLGEKPGPDQEPGPYDRLNVQIQTLEVVLDAMERAVRDVAAGVFASLEKDLTTTLGDAWAGDVWQTKVWPALRAVANVPFPSEPRDLKAFNASLVPPLPVAKVPFFVASDAYEKALFAQNATLLATYDDFDRVDSNLYPVEAVAGLHAHDVIRVARVSPFDAQLGFARKKESGKVTGLRYGHFAAFFKRSWRSNDILWGQLDGASELVETLLDVERVEALFGVATPLAGVLGHLNRVIDEIEQDSSALCLDKSDRSELFDWLRRLGSADWDERKAAVLALKESKESGCTEGPFDLLIQGCQLEILPLAIRNVYFDQKLDQLEEENPAAGVVSGISAWNEAQAQTQELVDQHEVSAYFKSVYRVGDESLANIPPLLIVERLVNVVIVAQKALLNGLGARAVVVRSHPAYKVFFVYPPRIVSAVLAMLGGKPRALRTFAFVSIAYIIFSIVVLYQLREHLPVAFEKQFGFIGTAFIGLPVVLALSLWLVARLRGAKSWPHVLLRVVVGVIALDFVALCVPAMMAIPHAPPVKVCASLPEVVQYACARWEWVHEPIIAAMPWLVLVSALLGLLSLLGVLGWLEWRARELLLWAFRPVVRIQTLLWRPIERWLVERARTQAQKSRAAASGRP